MLKFFLRRRFCLKRSETLTEPSADRFEPSKSFEVHMVFNVKNFFSRKAKKFIENSGNVRAKYKVRNFFQEKYVQLIHTPLKGNGCYFLRLSSCSFPFLHLLAKIRGLTATEILRPKDFCYGPFLQNFRHLATVPLFQDGCSSKNLNSNHPCG